MIKSYLIAAFRALKKDKVHTLINITGLSLGMMATIIAFMFIMDEISFDQFHTKKDRIFYLNNNRTGQDGVKVLSAESSGMMGPTMVDEFPEVEKVVRYQPWFDEIVLSYLDKNVAIKEGDLVFADSTFFDVFDFKLLEGNPKTALTRPLTIVLTEKTAHELFGDREAIGKTVKGMSGFDFEVTGIAEEPPRNSHIQYRGLMSWTTTVPKLGPLNLDWLNNWIAQAVATYILVKEGTDIASLEAKFPKFMKTHMPTRADMYHLYLQPFTEKYLWSGEIQFDRMAKRGNAQYLQLFAMIAGFILFIACINYINISTSKSTRRSREVGMRKTLGAGKRQLISQFMGESLLLTVCSAILAIGMIYLALPVFNSLAGKSVPLNLLSSGVVVGGICVLIFLVGVISGAYPALVISSFSPAEVLRATGQSKITGSWPRYILITFQFAVSIMMIAGTLLVNEQIHFLLSKDLGFDQEHVIVMNLTDEIRQKRNIFQKEINALPGVVTTSMGRRALGKGTAGTFIVPEGFPPNEVEIRMFPSDANFQKAYSLKMASGHFFVEGVASDSNSLVINEALARRLKWDDPLKKTIKFNEGEQAMPIIGVVKDFHFKSLYDEVEPIVMWVSSGAPSFISIRFNGNPSNLITHLETRWKAYESRYPFRYSFVDQDFARYYESEQKLFSTVITFAGLSIVIACLGLYGLVSYTIEQRTKEFGIRKVLGASVVELNFLVNKKFLLLIVLAAMAAIPVVVLFSEKWLHKFAFKITVGPGIFIYATLMTLTVTIVAVSIHAIKVARANPVESLRHE